MARRNYNSRNQKGNESEKKCESTQRTIAELKQSIAQLKADRRHRERIRKLKSGEASVEELDVIPFFHERDWESYEQYQEIVGGVPGTEGYRGD